MISKSSFFFAFMLDTKVLFSFRTKGGVSPMPQVHSVTHVPGSGQLKARKIPTRLVYYKEEGHGLDSPVALRY